MNAKLLIDLTVYRLTDAYFDIFLNGVGSWETGKLVGNTTYFILTTDEGDVFVGHVQNNDLITWNKLPSWKRVPDVTKVHVIFMNHLDVGYDGIFPEIGFINHVLNKYFGIYFPRAISLAKGIERWNSKLSFIYTTHPWLVSLYLDCPPNMVLNGIQLLCPLKEDVDAMVDAIKSGYIVMHAGAMNMQYGIMNSDTVVASVKLVQQIYRQLGIDYMPRVLSLRDVPGLTRNSITALSYAGIEAISVGVNSYTSPPVVPQLFKWQGDLSVLGMWHKGGYPLRPGSSLTNPGGLSYGDCLIIPEQKVALAFAFRTDNTGPPISLSEIEENFNVLHEEFPDADIFASTFDRFYDEVLNKVTDIPTVKSEIGDTWLQGIQSDPRKTAEYLSLQKAYSNCVAASGCMDDDPRVLNATRFMIKLAEHTWGLNGVFDSKYWSNKEFYEVRDQLLTFENAKNSWVEQRAFINLTLEALGDHPLATMMRDELETTKAKLPPLGDCNGLSISNPVYDFTVNNTKMHIQFDVARGALSALQVSDTGQWLLKDTHFGEMTYHTYNETDFVNFAHMYNYYGNAGFDKPNCTNADPVSKVWNTKPTGFFYCHPATFIVSMEMQDPTSHSYYGAPSQIWMNYTFVNYNSLIMELQLLNKTPTRLGEATMLNFYLPTPVNNDVSILYDLSNEASVFDVLLNGSQLQHGGYGVRTELFTIESHHTQVICPIPYPEGHATPFAAPLTPLDHMIGVAFNIHNNIWNTNYPLWYPFTDEDADFKATFTAKLTPPQ